jgi:hypothetical protein
MLDPDFSVTAWVVSKVHTEARGRTPRPPCPRCVEGCVGSFSLGWGRSVHQLLGQVEEGGTRPCGVEMIEFLSC